MNDIQELIQADQVLAVAPAPVFQLQETPSVVRPYTEDQEPQTCSIDKPAEDEAREPLRELCKNDKGVSEAVEQEQDNEEEVSDQNSKITDCVVRALEKITTQKVKTSKLSAILDKTGQVSEKKVLQIQNLIQDFEDIQNENSNPDLVSAKNRDSNQAKENLLPLESKSGVKVDALVPTSKSKSASPVKTIADYSIEDVLQISRRDISYGLRFPGQIVEESLDIVNKSNQDFVVQIIVTCLNEELDDTEEYVYSVRRSHLYDYNDKHYLIMAPRSCASFKFTLKIPNLRLNGVIIGQVKISVQGMSGAYTLDLSASVCVPKIFCPKELHFKGLNYNVIKLAVKEGKKQDMKIPIRNSGDIPITLELEFYEPKDQGTSERPPFDCLVHPNVITIAPNNSTLTTIMVKPWKLLTPLKDIAKTRGSRKILTGRVRDSALVYSFVFWVEVY